jgi:carboxyl-terminal processing protease
MPWAWIEPDIIVEPARIEKVDTPRGRRESDLRGALRNDQQSQTPPGAQPQTPPGARPATPPSGPSPESEVEPSAIDSPADYQLARAFDLLRGLALYNKRVSN